MNDTSLAAQATLERTPAPEIQGNRSQPGRGLAVAGDETIELDVPSWPRR